MSCVTPFILSPNPDQTHSMAFKARRDNCLYWGGDLTRRAFEEIFWGAEILNMVFWVAVIQMHHATVKLMEQEGLCILLHVKCTAM